MTKDNFIDHFRQEFFQEAREILESISDDILKLEADPENEELLNAVFRGIHTIKGSAGSFGLTVISDFTHHLEGLLNFLRDGRLSLSPGLVDVILSGSDQIGEMIEVCAGGGVPDLNQELINRIAALFPEGECKPDAAGSPANDSSVSGNSDVNDPGTGASVSDKLVKNASKRDQPVLHPIIMKEAVPAEIYEIIVEQAIKGQHCFKITPKYTSAHFENGYDPMVFLKNLYDGCSFYHVVLNEPNPVPSLKTFEPLHLYLYPVIYVATAMNRDEILDLVFSEELIEVENLVEKTSGGTESYGSATSDERHVGRSLINDIVGSEEAMAEFIDGAMDMLQTAEKAVMAYEENGSSMALDELFRVIHNIKGDADLMGFEDLVRFTHAFESVLDLLRLKKLGRTSQMVELILQSVDFIKKAISQISEHRPVHLPGSLYKSIKQHLESISGKDTGDAESDEAGFKPAFRVADEELREVYLEQILQFKAVLIQCMEEPASLYSVGISVKRTLQDIVRAARMVGHNFLEQSAATALCTVDKWKENAEIPDGLSLENFLGTVMAAIQEFIGEPKKIGEILISEGKIKKEDLVSALEAQKPVGQILLESGKVEKTDLDAALNKQKLISAVQKQNEEEQTPSIKTMRVDEQKVESFSNLVGEMLVARNTYAYLLSRLTASCNDKKIMETIKDLKENLHLFSRLTNDVQHGVISLRMIPVRGIFQKFSRVVRDISRKQNKMILMLTDGEDIEIDKKVADVLSDPLIHLIRNACDHGIETPLERKRAGKPEKGTVLLKASREGSHIVIRINDDGRGINRQKLLEKAKKHGLDFVSADDPGLLDMIFMPGLSTAEVITDVSGRGVGMDVVKTTIHSLGGGVSVISEKGMGTQITLTIPSSMGIDTVLFVEAGGNSYAIPITCILETLKVRPETFIRAGEQLMFHYRGEVLSAHFLEELLNPLDGEKKCLGDKKSGWSRDRMSGFQESFSKTRTAKTSMDEVPMVILKTSRHKFGVIIDRFDKNMEIAVKPMPDMLSELDVISGISILGDGKVLLVINPEQLSA